MIQVLAGMHRSQAGVIKIADSTAIPVCKIYRASSNKVMKRLASKSKGTTGWFYGIRLHTVVDLQGHILRLAFTTARVGEREVLERFFESLQNSLILADAGYLSKELAKRARLKNIVLLTPSRKNMKKITTILQNLLLNLRGRVETVYSVLKERMGLVSTLARSVNGYISHCIRVIFTYMFQPFTTMQLSS
jgi:IS5 family transposase